MVVFVKFCLRCKSPLAAMTWESTQLTLNTAVQYGTFVLEFVQIFAETIARNDPR